jgi:hypothetical protein
MYLSHGPCARLYVRAILCPRPPLPCHEGIFLNSIPAALSFLKCSAPASHPCHDAYKAALAARPTQKRLKTDWEASSLSSRADRQDARNITNQILTRNFGVMSKLLKERAGKMLM